MNMAYSTYYDFLYDIDPRDNPAVSTDEHYLRITPNSYFDLAGAMLETPPNPGPPAPVPAGNPDWIEPGIISDTVMAQPKDGAGNDIETPNSYGFNEFGQFFGQYLTHDVAEAAVGGPDPIRLDRLPFPFARTPADTVDGVREQHNHETSVFDLSTVYGRTTEMLDLLRQGADGAEQSAYLVMGDDPNSYHDLLPTFTQVAADSGVDIADVLDILAPDVPAPVSPDQFAAGDDRLNQQSPLLTHHTVWARNHNWHVDQLKAKHGDWTEEQYFQAARALNEAEWQSVVYDEYVARLIGKDALEQYSGYTGVDHSVINEWATIGFRFGHDQSSNLLTLVAQDGTQTGTHTLAEAFGLGGSSTTAFSTGTIEDWLRGQTELHTQEIDGYVVEGNRGLLFNIGGGTVTTDLEVFDIARGRDHGMSKYNVLREGLGLSTYDDTDGAAAFQAFGDANDLDQARVDALIEAYTHNGEVRFDLFDSVVAAQMEKPVYDSMLGETNTLLNVLQFEAFRDGDEFYYENRFADNPELIEQIKYTSMADILVRNTDMEYAYHDAFEAHNRIGGNDYNNTVKGTNDVDLLMGYKGDDYLKGLDGDDDLYGGEGKDDLRGGNGNDHLWGEEGKDKLFGNDGDDKLYGGEDKDDLQGGNGNDHLHGERDDDRLRGNGGDDYLDGGEGDDVLQGGSGADHLVGGLGKDFQQGGGGDDVFDFNSIYESGNGEYTADIIADFKGAGNASKGDVIDLSDIYLPDDGVFYFIGTYHFDGSGPQVRVTDTTVNGKKYTLVQLDTDYDAETDMAILVDDGKQRAEDWVAEDFYLS